MTTEWETIDRGLGGRGKPRPHGWYDFPAVGINKTGLTLNQKFCDLFVKNSKQAFVMFASSDRKIGLKLLPAGESDEKAFTISANKSHVTKVQTKHIVCKRLMDQITDCIGGCYRAHANPNGHVIEIELSTANKMK